MGIPGTESPFFRYLFISAGNSSQKAGDNNAPQDRVEKQREADATEGEYPPPKLERTKTITAVYQRLIIAGLNVLLSLNVPRNWTSDADRRRCQGAIDEERSDVDTAEP